jgi:hypothetical protein
MSACEQYELLGGVLYYPWADVVGFCKLISFPEIPFVVKVKRH